MASKGEIPVLRILLPLIAGIVAAYYFPSEVGQRAASALVFLSLTAMGLLLMCYKRPLVYRNRWLTGSIVHVFMLSTGYVSTIDMSGRLDLRHFTRQQADAFLTEVISEPRMSGDVLRFEGRISRSYHKGIEKASVGKISLSLRDSTGQGPALQYGDVFLMAAVHTPIDPPFNPGEFDYRLYLADRQIYSQAFLQPETIYSTGLKKGNPVISFALGLRAALVQKLHRYIGDASAAAFASTLILGYRADLSKELVEAYSKTGTMHVLSVSGMHVGIVFLVLSFLLKFMNRDPGSRCLRAAIIIICIWFYALITGFSAPANRAAIMLSFVVLGKALSKKQNTYNLIAISALFLLLYNPFYLFDAGFQLSYLAVTGLVYFHPRIYKALYIKNTLLDYVWSYCALSLAAQLATFPLSIYYFHQFPMYFLVSNLLIVFPVAVIMYLGMVFLFIPSPLILYHIGGLMGWLIHATNSMLFYIENLPSSSWDGIWITSLECLLICLILVCSCAMLLHAYRRAMWPLALMLLILVSSFSIRRIRAADTHELVFFNLRKKSGMAYIAGQHSTVITDLHPTDKQISYSVLTTLEKLGSSNERFYRYTDTTAGRNFVAQPNFYQFGDYKLLRWDKEFDRLTFNRLLHVDAVLISANPRTSVKRIIASVRCGRLIIDANNPDYKIRQWLAEAAQLKMPCYVLKKNPALIVKL